MHAVGRVEMEEVRACARTWVRAFTVYSLEVLLRTFAFIRVCVHSLAFACIRVRSRAFTCIPVRSRAFARKYKVTRDPVSLFHLRP